MAMQTCCGLRILKPSELTVGDVVCFANASGRFPFGDMEVVKEEEKGWILRRPYITETGEAAYEEGYWAKDSDFTFHLLQRESNFCRNCGANIPPIAGEGTCPKCSLIVL